MKYKFQHGHPPASKPGQISCLQLGKKRVAINCLNQICKWQNLVIHSGLSIHFLHIKWSLPKRPTSSCLVYTEKKVFKKHKNASYVSKMLIQN